EGAARHQMALAQLDAERERLVQGLGQALRAQRAAAEDLLQARQQLETAALAMREQRLRRAGDVDQAWLGSLAAELEHGYAGLRLIAAWHGLWLREAALHLFVDDSVAHAPLLGPGTLDWQAPQAEARTSAVPRAARWQQGVYVWKSHALLDERRRAEALAQLRVAGMQRLYLGLDATQVAQPERLRDQLRGLLGAAREQGFEVLLLLGDPHWLQADGRQGLLDLLGELRALPFAGLHLDLEVEQLGWPVPEARLHDWVDTLAAVARVSPWPLELSSHHRWFAAPRAGEYCVPCELRQRGVRQVSLMIYTRNAARSAELAADIARRWPGLSFRLAQSVEPQLAADESWSAASRAQLQAQTERWRQQLQPQAVSGIDWQDWSHYPH
ncbi:MAG: TolC family protein, partial [Pseudomonadaceae bacterium]